MPCTPAGVMELLREAGAELEGARAVVIGRSILVGKPLAQLLLAANATVTHCHSRTRDLAAVCREADVLIAAVGSPGLVTARHGARGRRGDRRRAPTAPTPGWSATWTSRPSASGRGRSRRCPAGWGR